MRIVYFAWLRERLNRDFDDVSPPSEVTTVAELMDWLAGSDESFALATANRETIRSAVDDELLDHSASVVGARSVALFPPMTGG